MKFNAVQTLREQSQCDTRRLVLLVIDSFYFQSGNTAGKNALKPIRFSAKFESNHLLKTNKVAEFYRRLYSEVISSLVLDRIKRDKFPNFKALFPAVKMHGYSQTIFYQN